MVQGSGASGVKGQLFVWSTRNSQAVIRTVWRISSRDEPSGRSDAGLRRVTETCPETPFVARRKIKGGKDAEARKRDNRNGERNIGRVDQYATFEGCIPASIP